MTALQQLHSMVGKDENILWFGRPMKKCFFLEAIFNPMLPFVLLWGLIDVCILAGRSRDLFLVGFMILHLMPVWLYLGGILFVSVEYWNSSFIVTDKGVYISSGVFSLNFDHKPFMEISRVSLHRGSVDRMLGVGDVVLEVVGSWPAQNRTFFSLMRNPRFSIYDIPDYQEVYSLVKQLQQDIYSDVQYPNDLRPKENHGYNTAYIPPDKR